MNLINRIVNFIKSKFTKNDKPKALEKTNHEEAQEKTGFKESLSINSKNNVETLICPGDGLGIQNKISF